MCSRRATPAPRSPTRTSARARAVSVTGITISGTRRAATTAGKHDRVDDGEHHGPRADVTADWRQQGLRRHDRRHRDAGGRPRRPATSSRRTTRAPASPTRTSAPAKPVSVTGIAIIGGTDAGNYSWSTPRTSTTANITARVTDGDGDRREQGLRRHDRGDGDLDGQPRQWRCLQPGATPPPPSPTRTSARQAGDRQRHLDRRAPTRATTPSTRRRPRPPTSRRWR